MLANGIVETLDHCDSSASRTRETMLPKATSIAHQHFLGIINTEIGRTVPISPIRILDAGCGFGDLVAYLHECLPILHPDLKFEVYGFDVGGPRTQTEGGFTDKAISNLYSKFPTVDWEGRLTTIRVGDPWPYSDNSFDAIISNEVLEHVAVHEHFFEELSRTLKTGGFSTHIFPLKHTVIEGHSHIPFVHRIVNHDLAVHYFGAIGRFGFGRFKKASAETLHAFSVRVADWFLDYTNYVSYKQVLSFGKRHGLRTTFRYTQEFYTAKLRSLLGLRPICRYSASRFALYDWMALFFLKYISSVTLFLRKR